MPSNGQEERQRESRREHESSDDGGMCRPAHTSALVVETKTSTSSMYNLQGCSDTWKSQHGNRGHPTGIGYSSHHQYMEGRHQSAPISCIHNVRLSSQLSDSLSTIHRICSKELHLTMHISMSMTGNGPCAMHHQAAQDTASHLLQVYIAWRCLTSIKNHTEALAPFLPLHRCRPAYISSAVSGVWRRPTALTRPGITGLRAARSTAAVLLEVEDIVGQAAGHRPHDLCTIVLSLSWRPPRKNLIQFFIVPIHLHVSHQGEHGPITGWVTPGFSHVEIVPDDAAALWVFSVIFRFPRPFIPAQLHASITLVGSQHLAVKSRPNLFTHISKISDFEPYIPHTSQKSFVREFDWRVGELQTDIRMPGVVLCTLSVYFHSILSLGPDTKPKSLLLPRIWESYWTMPLVGGFPRGSPIIFAPLHSVIAPDSPLFTLIGS
ncbi:hypothetical protein PR048_023831 [Dryococelus australis]|uniref:Uncharacterized protein n=1 Tax=Dryococelus australis TaxID=614101 RepID=A0ABQ9GV51_9NEOP|nr:hypothetical protein PR048_023831 [Dryococelus australis]